MRQGFEFEVIDLQLDASATIGGQAAAGDDAMELRMVKDVLSPGVKDGEDGDAGAETSGFKTFGGSRSTAPRWRAGRATSGSSPPIGGDPSWGSAFAAVGRSGARFHADYRS